MSRPAILRRALPIVAIALLAACYGGGQAPQLDAAAFQEAVDQLGTMIERAQAGDVEGAEAAFARVQPFASLVDRALGDLPGEVIARAELFDGLTRIEQELQGERRADVLADMAEDTRRALANAAEALDVERPND